MPVMPNNLPRTFERISLFRLRELTPVHLIYIDSGYNDIFYIAIRSHRICYAATLIIALWINRLIAYSDLTLWKEYIFVAKVDCNP